MIAELKELEREVNEERCRKLSWFFGSRPESIPLPGSKLGQIVFHLTHFCFLFHKNSKEGNKTS